jgi:hypothetical protein
MSQPTPYARVNDFTTYARNNSAAPYNAAMLDAEFNAVSVSLNATITNIGLIQRDDGQLKNTVVTPDALNNATLNLIGDWTPKGPWLPSQAYAVRDMVTVDLVVSYVCAVAHLSSSFAVDLAAGYWQQVNGTDALVTNITFTQSDVVLGRVTSGGGPGEEIPCTSFARTLLDDASAAAALTTLGLGTGSNPTFNNLTVAGLVITGGIGSTFLYVDAGHGVTTAAPAPQNGQLLIGRTGLDPIVANITGISDQVNVTNGAGSITLSLPQSIAATSTPTFATVNLTNLAIDSIPVVGSSSALVQYSGLKWDHTTSRIQLTDLLPGGVPYIDGNNEITVNTARLAWNFAANGLGVGGTATSGFTVSSEVTNTTNDVGQVRAYYATGTLAATTTLLGAGYVSNLATVNSVFTLPDLEHFQALQTTRGASSAITRVKGFAAHKEIVNDIVTATSYGFWSDINTAASGTNYQLYMGGTAPSLFGGNLLVTGTAKRIQGDFSNATLTNRLMLQDATAANATDVGVIPGSSGSAVAVTAYGLPDPANSHALQLLAGATTTQLRSRVAGTGTQRPLDFVMQSTTAWSISTALHLLAGTDNTYDIGAAAATRPRTIYVGTSIVLNAPVTETNATRNVLDSDNFLICNRAGTVTLTFPAATAGKRLTVKTITANTVVSASSNVIPRTGGAAGTAILAATGGAWATLVANGTNWEIMAGS